MNAPISLRACPQCEKKTNSCPEMPICNEGKSRPEIENRFSQVPAFSDLLKKLFFEDNYGSGTMTLAIEPWPSENETTSSIDQIIYSNSSQISDRSTTPASNYSPLTLGSTHGSDRKRSYEAKLSALLYPVSLSVGILQVETPHSSESTPEQNSVLFDNDRIDNDRFRDFTEDSPGYYSSEMESVMSNQIQGSGIAFKSSLKPASAISSSSSSSKTTPVLRSRKSESVRGLRPVDDQHNLLTREGNGNRHQGISLSRTISNNSLDSRCENTRSTRIKHSTPTIPMSSESRLSKTVSSRGSDDSRSGIVDRERGSRRSIAVANTLFGILNSSRLDGKSVLRNQLPLARTRKKPDMKLLLKQSLAGPFEGLQLDLVDPDFVFPGSSSVDALSNDKRSSHCGWGNEKESIGKNSSDPVLIICFVMTI